jgi:hypothetical protein
MKAAQEELDECQQRLEAEHKLAELFKVELEASRRETARMAKRLECLPGLEWVLGKLISCQINCECFIKKKVGILKYLK